MMDDEKRERMVKCAYNPPGGFLCQMDGCPPFDCWCCEDYIDATKGNEEVDGEINSFGNVRVFVPADELLGFYTQNKKRCQEEMILIAENTETGYAVYMTDDDGTLMFSVCRGEDAPECEEYVSNGTDCEESAKRLIMRYLVPLTVVDGEAAFPGIDDDMEDKMYEREDALDLAIKDFLAVVLQEPDGETVSTKFGEDFTQEVLHHILEYLTEVHCIKIFRPMFFRDDGTENEIYSEYPYEEYTFSDDGRVQ